MAGFVYPASGRSIKSNDALRVAKFGLISGLVFNYPTQGIDLESLWIPLKLKSGVLGISKSHKIPRCNML